ncbi:DoxX family protein [Saccharomonospora sp. NPDC046836]|uniref:DoxX family protein n=1 Tax=Saccharomonospora sp. NPDC046836 TaxID=3156921 RepID=UPI0034115CEC
MSTRDDFDAHTTKITDETYDQAGFSSGAGLGQTTSLAAPNDDIFGDEDKPDRWHGGLDFGLLVLRLALGGTMAAHGLQKLFGLFDGPGIDGFAEVLRGLGYTSQTTLLSWITGIAELGGGALLILGLFTPLGAAALLGVVANIIYAKYTLGGRFFTGEGAGFEYELMLGAMAFALLFTGSGRVAIDKNTPWRSRPLPFALMSLVLAGAATAVVIFLFR